MTSHDDGLLIPTRAELAGEPPLSCVPVRWDGPVPGHVAAWGCCEAPWSVHRTATELDQTTTRHRESS